MVISYKWKGSKFIAKESFKDLFKGSINELKVEEFSTDTKFSESLLSFFKAFGITSGKRDKTSFFRNQPKTLIANFFFIRGIFDYANIVPSHFFWLNMIDLFKSKPFLFDPSDRKWDVILSEPEDKQIKLLYPFLIRFNGFFRRKFETDIKAWINIIRFLRKTCSNNASLFYISMCNLIGIDYQDSNALEKMQKKLESSSKFKKKNNINFPYGKKASRLMINLMASFSGGSLLEGVTHTHLKGFCLPVDSQIIRVTLNLGLIDINWTENSSLEKHGIKSKGVIITRDDFAEPCQKVWQTVSQKTNILPADLDFFIWQIGSIFGKKFGRFCYMCPIADKCDSWTLKRIKEASVSNPKESCFNFCRPKPSQDFLLLRGCENCVHRGENLYRGRCDSCSSIEVFSDTKKRIEFSDIETYLESKKINPGKNNNPKKGIDNYF